MVDVVADRVIVELEAKLGQYEANVAKAETKFSRAMSGIQKSAGATEAFVSRAVGGMALALGAVSVSALVQAFLTLADESKKLDAQLKLATSTFGAYGQAQDDVRRIADETRSGLAETATLYGNFIRNAKDLGASQTDAARATETFSKTLKISGAGTAEAASATLQFGQALAAGALRGDELNSIMEASPRLSRLLADSLGVSVGQLRKMGEQGEITSQKLLKALTDQKFTKSIDNEFKQLPVTFDQAMTKVHNAAVVVFGAFDQGGEFSTALASFVSGGAEGFADLEKAAEEFGISVRGTLDGLSSAFAPLVEAGEAAFAALGLSGRSFADDLRSILSSTFGEIDAVTKWLSERPLGRIFGIEPTNARGRFDSAASQSDRRRQGEAADGRFRNRFGGFDALGNPLGQAGTARAVPATAKKGPKSPLRPDAFAREEASLNDEILRLKADEITDAQERAAAELSRVEASKAAAIADVNNDKRYTEEQKKRIVALTETVSALEEARIIRDRDIQASKDALDLKLSALKNDRDLLDANSRLASTRSERRDIELRLLDLAYQQERAELEAVVASKDASKVQKDIAQARLGILGRLQSADTAGVNQQFESPMERYQREVGDVGRSINDSLEQVQVDGLKSLNDGITDAIMGAKSLGDAFGDVAKQIIADLVRIAVQQQIVAPLLGLSGGGFLGGILGFAGGGSGIIGGRGGTDTNVLSLNGRPFANVTRGESLSIGNKAIPGRRGDGTTVNQTFVLDARYGITTTQLLQHVENVRQEAARNSAQMGRGVLKAMPARLSQFQSDGT